MSDRVTVEIEDRVAVVTLNRPDKLNAVDLKMFAALGDAGEQLAQNVTVRAVVLQGAGSSFCAGVDLGIFREGDEALGGGKMAPGKESPANFFQHAAYVWRELPVPVICAIHGNAFGAGLQLALGADLRYATPDSQLSIMEVKWGILPDMAITQTLLPVMPIDRIKELAWTGRVVNGTEAEALGLVTAVHPDPAAAARDTARLIAARSPDAIRAIKKLFNESQGMRPAEALQLEAKLQQALLGGSNQTEAVMANLQKREPDFDNPAN